MDPCFIAQPELLVRPAPTRHEGPQGYLLRLAEANCMTMKDLVQMGVRLDRESLIKHQLLPALEMDPGLHAHVEAIALLSDEKGQIWNKHYARFCPHCLLEDPSWKAPWELHFYDVCAEHGTWMVDRCGSCGETIKWNRDSLLRCDCGSDLRQETSKPAPENLQRLSNTLQEKLFQKNQSHPPPLTDLRVDQLQRMIRFLGTHMDPMPTPRPLKLRNVTQLDQSWPVSSLAAELIFQWPNAFHQALSHLNSSNAGEKQGLMNTFRHAYTYLYRGFNAAEFWELREAFELWMATHWKGGIAKRNRRLPPELLKEVQWIPGTVAAEQLGISLPRVRHLVQEKRLDGEESISAKGRRFIVVRRDQLEQISAEMVGEITMGEAMEMLGIGKIRMQRLLRLLFPNARRTWDKVFLPWRIPRGEIESILDAVTDLPVLGIQEEHQVSLGYLLKYWGWSGEEVLALIEAVKAGTLKPKAFLDGAKGISRWIFDSGELKVLQKSLRAGLSNWVSIPEMARILGVKQQVAYWLTRHGFVKAEKLGRLKNLGSRIRKEDLELFRQNHIFAREIASMLGRSSKKIYMMLAEQGIDPLRGTGPEPCRMLVYAKNHQIHRFLAQISGKHPNDFKLVAPLEPEASNRIIESDDQKQDASLKSG